MFDNLKTYNYSKALVSPEGYGRHESNFLSGDIINGFEAVIGTGLQVTTKPGNAVLRFGSGGTASAYLASLTADFTTTLATADTSNPRIDAIVLYVDTSVSLPSGTPTAANLDGLGVAKIIKVNGTPAASPSAPTATMIQTAIDSTSYPYTVLATWRVNAGVSALSQTNCTDTRVFAAPRNDRALGQTSFVESGGVASFTNATLNGSITAGTAWINVGGVFVPQVFNSLNFTTAASKDRYYYVTLGNSTIQAASDATNGGVSPTLPANSVWVVLVVSGASAISAVHQTAVDTNGKLICPRAIGAKTTDANGWTVRELGGSREYVRNVSISTGSIPAQGAAASANFAPPVSITDLSNREVYLSLRATGFDANRFSYCLQQRSLPANLFIEFFNTWTGGALVVTGTVTVRIVA